MPERQSGEGGRRWAWLPTLLPALKRGSVNIANSWVHGRMPVLLMATVRGPNSKGESKIDAACLHSRRTGRPTAGLGAAAVLNFRSITTACWGESCLPNLPNGAWAQPCSTRLDTHPSRIQPLALQSRAALAPLARDLLSDEDRRSAN